MRHSPTKRLAQSFIRIIQKLSIFQFAHLFGSFEVSKEILCIYIKSEQNIQMNGQEGYLLSLTSKKNWKCLSEPKRTQLLKETKSRIAVMFIQVSQCIESKDFQRARKLLICIADSCSFIEEPDEQVINWGEISCQYIGLIHKHEQKNTKNCPEVQKDIYSSLESSLTLTFSKFSNEFKLSSDDFKDNENYEDVLQYTSKINGKLFGYQNPSSNYSLYIVFTSYLVAFISALALLTLVLVYISLPSFLNQIQEPIAGLSIPSVVLGILLSIPMCIIFFKTPQQKSVVFFSKVLGQQLKNINEDCVNRGKGIQFFISHNGLDIIIKLDRKKKGNFNQLSSTINENEHNNEEFMTRVQGIKNQFQKVSQKHFPKSSFALMKESPF